MREFQFSKNSLSALEGVHPDLIAVARLGLRYSRMDFSVVEGVRSLEQQKEYLADGVTTTLNSRHLTGHAVDLYPWDGGTTHAADAYAELERAIKQASITLNIPVEWGGDWSEFVDRPHWELPWEDYPDGD